MLSERHFEEPLAHLVWHMEFGNLEGLLLTIVDATTHDPKQREATKSLVRKSLRGWINDLPKLKSEGIDSPNFKVIDPVSKK